MLKIFLKLLMLQLSSWYNVESLSAFDELLFNKTYDPTLRPLYGERPLDLSYQFSIASLGPINVEDMTFHVSFYSRQRWNDPRLVHNHSKNEIVSNVFPGGKIWIPDIYVVNSRDTKYINDFTRTIVKKNGDVYFSSLVVSKCICLMWLQNYPMDNQTCFVQLESYAFNIKEIRLRWYDKFMLTVPATHKRSLTGYDVTKVTKEEKDISYGDGDFDTFANVFIYFHVERTSIYFIYKAFLPSIFLTVFNIGSYFIPDDAMPARVTLIITTFLANMLILQSVTEETTQVSYTTAMQIFLLVNLLFLVVSVIQYLILLVLRKRASVRKLNGQKNSKSPTPLKIFTNGHCNNNDENKITNGTVTKRSSNSAENQTEETLNFTKHLEILEKGLFSDKIPDRVHILDQICRVLIPFLYILFCIIYFAYFR